MKPPSKFVHFGKSSDRGSATFGLNVAEDNDQVDEGQSMPKKYSKIFAQASMLTY